MNLRVGLFDLQFLKYAYVHTPFPSTAGLILAGYHKMQKDNVVLLDKVPNFTLYDLIYIIKDDWDLYHDTTWLQHPNVKLVGRFWDPSMSSWEQKWQEYPPDIQPYRRWAEDWLKRYPYYKKKRIEHFWYEPVLLNTGKKILNPDSFETLLIDYNLHLLDDDYSTLKELHCPSIKMLQPLDVTHNTEAAFQFLKQRNVRRSVWITLDRDAPEEEMQRIINMWNKYRLGREIRMKIWIEAHKDEDWEQELKKTIPFLAKWREQAGKRIFVEPVDLYSYSHPDILIGLRRWTGRDMGYAYNSLLDYLIYDSIAGDNKAILAFLEDPYTYIENERKGCKKMQSVVRFLKEEPELSRLISTPVNGKGV